MNIYMYSSFVASSRIISVDNGQIRAGENERHLRSRKNVFRAVNLRGTSHTSLRSIPNGKLADRVARLRVVPMYVTPTFLRPDKIGRIVYRQTRDTHTVCVRGKIISLYVIHPEHRFELVDERRKAETPRRKCKRDAWCMRACIGHESLRPSFPRRRRAEQGRCK